MSLKSAIDHAAHLLPAQGPITVFIHHNTLHAFEDLPFTEAVVHGGWEFGCQPFLTEERYRDELVSGRIRLDDLDAMLRDDLGTRADEPIPPHGTRLQLRRAMLQYPTRTGTRNELFWFVAEADALRQVRPEVSAADRDRLVSETRRWVLRGGHGPAGLSELMGRFGTRDAEAWRPETWEAFTLQALWRLCRTGAETVEPLVPERAPPVRHRDLLLEVTGADADLLVHDLLIKFCAAFLDQGLAHWALPNRDAGFFRAFCELHVQSFGTPEPWRRGLAAELVRQAATCADPLDSISDSLELLGVPEAEWAEYLSATLLALRGWGGILRFLEERGDRAVLPAPAGSLVEFLAIRLILDRLAVAHLAREALGFRGPLGELRGQLQAQYVPPAPPSAEQRAFQVFRLTAVMGWKPEELAGLAAADWARLFGEVEGFSGMERRRLFHLAYERRFYIRCLDALALHSTPPTPARPRFQALFCIDEREESIRRHLEEVAPDAETLSTAGFYSVPMYYKGAADAHYTPLCPAVMRPTHWVTEEVVSGRAKGHRWRAQVRRAFGAASYRVHVGSRKFLTGALLAVAGVFAGFPLVTRTLFPRLAARLRRRATSFVRPVATRLRLERTDANPGPDGPAIGFHLAEMAGIAEKVLRETGLTRNFARLVFVLGHGSTSMNNPHESAHDCGACGGSRGGPNGRALAQILNDPRVRVGLAEGGIAVPAETVFVGGMHNTSSEELVLYDLDRVPSTHRPDLEAARRDLEAACDRDAHERARRFLSAPLSLTSAAARRHMEGRAEDLAQVRPEWGHATNALCIVGRRARTRGLFLDRRAFLNSYDPTQDDAEGTVLARILQAVFPVCGGINLEYYFSYVDNPGYGCGTKLPHNITSLLGVMDGAGSDLRTGLPWQMVEIHEPVRLLVVLETWPKVIQSILDREPMLARLVRNEWLRLALLDPDSPTIRKHQNGAFVVYEPEAIKLPRAATSEDWYRGWRDYLDFAEIGKKA